jgi:hypothetical protein
VLHKKASCSRWESNTRRVVPPPAHLQQPLTRWFCCCSPRASRQRLITCPGWLGAKVSCRTAEEDGTMGKFSKVIGVYPILVRPVPTVGYTPRRNAIAALSVYIDLLHLRVRMAKFEGFCSRNRENVAVPASRFGPKPTTLQRKFPQINGEIRIRIRAFICQIHAS